MVSILVHGDGFEPPVLAPEEVLRYRQAHSPLCHPCIFNFWRRVQELNPLTPSALTLTGFQDQRLTVRPTLRCSLPRFGGDAATRTRIPFSGLAGYHPAWLTNSPTS